MSKKFKVMNLPSMEETIELVENKNFKNELKVISNETEFRTHLDNLNSFYRNGNPLISDIIYDEIEEMYEKKFKLDDDEKLNRYNRGHSVGTNVSNNLNKIQLSRKMPSLNKSKSKESLERFFIKYPLKFDQKDYLVVSQKLNGTSALLSITNDGNLQLISHGNTRDIGFDLNHLLPFIKNFPNKENVQKQFQKMGISDVRGELIIEKKVFEELQRRSVASSTMEFNTALSSLVGIIKDSKPNKDLLKCVSFVAYETYYFDNKLALKKTVLDRFRDAESCGFDCAYPELIDHHLLYEEASDLKLKTAEKSKYEIDGIVFAINNQYKVQGIDSVRLEPKNLGKNIMLKETDEMDDVAKPDMCIAFKVDTMFADTEVLDVVYETTRFGKIFPSNILLSPVVIQGANHDRCTGKTTRFIVDTRIEPGQKIQVSKCGEIILNYHKTLSPGPTSKGKLPPGVEGKDWYWDENKTHTYVTDIYREDVQLARLIGYFAAFNATGMREGVVTKLFKHFKNKSKKRTTHGPLAEILSCTEQDLAEIPGFKAAMTKKIYESIQSCKDNVKLDVLLNASSLLTEGFGIKRFGIIVNHFGNEILQWEEKQKDENIAKLNALGGFNELAKQFVHYLKVFQDWIEELPMMTIAKTVLKRSAIPKASFGRHSSSSSSLLTSKIELPKNVCFSGFRNENWEELITENGGKIQNTVNGKTNLLVVANKNESSKKINDARDKNVLILDRMEFFSKYKLSSVLSQ